MKYFISIQYERKFYQIRFSSKSFQLLKDYSNLEDLMYIKVGVDTSKKILAFKPLEEETEDSYHFAAKNCISSVELTKILQSIAGHSGLFRYPLQWHTDLALAVVDLKKGQQQ